MFIRFWRRFTIFPGVRLNVSKTGMSLSFGRRGFWLTFGRHGVRFTTGLTGTGLFATEHKSYSDIKSYVSKKDQSDPLSTEVFIEQGFSSKSEPEISSGGSQKTYGKHSPEID